MDVLEVNFIRRARNRKMVLAALEKQPKTNSYLVKELKLDMGNIRKLFDQLEDRGLIICKNPDDYHSKLYEITRKGRKVLKEIKKIETL